MMTLTCPECGEELSFDTDCREISNIRYNPEEEYFEYSTRFLEGIDNPYQVVFCDCGYEFEGQPDDFVLEFPDNLKTIED